MKPLVLLVMAPDRRTPLLKQLEACGIQVLAARDCSEARRILRAQPGVQVVLTDEALADGDWLSVLDAVSRSGVHAETIVCTRLGDPRLWIHVLVYGAYDLLVEPYNSAEVRRIIESAAADQSRLHSHAATG